MKLHAPATARNREPIRGVLATALADGADVLEIGAGTGEHAVHFAAAFPGVTWRPTDVEPESLASIDAWAAEAGTRNVRPAARLDVTEHPWPGIADGSIDAVVSINMIHIAPWDACEGLIAGAGRALRPGGVLVLYGPFRLDGRHTAPSNAAFDRSLRAMDPAFGVRDLADVTDEAEAGGFAFETRIAMPANNFSVVFRRR